jgi:hypothetical protein
MSKFFRSPLTDAALGVWEGIGADSLLDGTYYLEFQGQATVRLGRHRSVDANHEL